MLTNLMTPNFIWEDIKVILFPISSSVIYNLVNHSVVFLKRFTHPLSIDIIREKFAPYDVAGSRSFVPNDKLKCTKTSIGNSFLRIR